MADIKALKDSIWLKKEEIKKEDEARQEWADQASAREVPTLESH